MTAYRNNFFNKGCPLSSGSVNIILWRLCIAYNIIQEDKNGSVYQCSNNNILLTLKHTWSIHESLRRAKKRCYSCFDVNYLFYHYFFHPVMSVSFFRVSCRINYGFAGNNDEFINFNYCLQVSFWWAFGCASVDVDVKWAIFWMVKPLVLITVPVPMKNCFCQAALQTASFQLSGIFNTTEGKVF